MTSIEWAAKLGLIGFLTMFASEAHGVEVLRNYTKADGKPVYGKVVRVVVKRERVELEFLGGEADNHYPEDDGKVRVVVR